MSLTLKNALKRTHIASLTVEGCRSTYEAFRFIEQEIHYTKKVCGLQRDPDNRQYPFFGNLSSQVVLMERALEQLRQVALLPKYEQLGKETDDASLAELDLERLRMVRDSLDLISATLQDVQNAVTQRRFRNSSAMSLVQVQLPHKRMRLSEVHLDFADTYRAIYSLADRYASRCISPYFSNAVLEEAGLPTIVVSRGEAFCLELFSVRVNDFPVFLDPATKIVADKSQERSTSSDLQKALVFQEIVDRISVPELTEYFKYLVGFSRVVTPRFFPVMIRYAPLLAHELFHLVVRSAELIADSNSYRFFSSEVDGNLPETDFGGPMCKLAVDFQALSDSLFRFLSDTYYVVNTEECSHGNDPSAAVGRHGVCIKEHIDSYKFFFGGDGTNGRDRLDTLCLANQRMLTSFKNRLEEKARQFAVELLADICALIVTPSYLPALICHSYGDSFSVISLHEDKEAEDRYFQDVGHPPMPVRANILQELARTMGFTRLADRTAQLIEDWNAEPAVKRAYLETWNTWRMKWWENKETQALIGDIVVSFRSAVHSSWLYFECSGQNRTVDQDKLECAFDEICSWVQKGQLIWDNKTSVRERMAAVLGADELEGKFELEISDVMDAMWYKLLADKYEMDERQRLQWRLVLSKNFGG
jgi:hypothetical protein